MSAATRFPAGTSHNAIGLMSNGIKFWQCYISKLFFNAKSQHKCVLARPPHEPLGTSNIQHPTPNRQSMAQLETIGCSMLDVGCWMFSFGSGVQCAKFSGKSFHEPQDSAQSFGGHRDLKF